MPRDTFFLEFDSPSKDLFPTVCIQQVWITNHKQYWTNESWTAVESVPVRLRNATQFLSENSRYPGQEPPTWCSGVSWHKCRLECRLFSSRCFLRPFQAMKVTSSFFFHSPQPHPATQTKPIQWNSPPSEANISSASQEIDSVLRNSQFHYGIHKGPPLVPVLSQTSALELPYPISWIPALTL